MNAGAAVSVAHRRLFDQSLYFLIYVASVLAHADSSEWISPFVSYLIVRAA
jgi:hypothetical protein